MGVLNKNLVLFGIISLILCTSFISAVICNSDLPNGCPEEKSTTTIIANYSGVNVNNSQFLQGYTPTTLRDWMQTTFDTLYSGIQWAYNQTLATGWINDGTQSYLIDSNDKVGIGTSSPEAKVGITGTEDEVQLLIKAFAQNNDTFRIEDSKGNTLLVVDSDGSLNVTATQDVCITGGNCLSSVGGGSTYNETYDTWAYNQTYSGSTYNATYDIWAYNQSSSGGTPEGNNGTVQFNKDGAFAGNSNLTWDNVNNRLGIGTSGPDFPLNIYGIESEGGTQFAVTNNASNTASGGGFLNFYRERSGAALGSTEDIGGLRFYGRTGAAYKLAGGILAENTGGSWISGANRKMDLTFSTVHASSTTDKLNIKSSGEIQLLLDSQKLQFGAGQDASIYYNGSDLIINSRDVGTGKLFINGDTDVLVSGSLLWDFR